MLKGIFKRFNHVVILSLLAISASGIDPASALDTTPQSLLPEKKVNSSGELAVELPPRVFPNNSDEDKPNRQGEELPPSVFPKDFGGKSHSEYEDTHLGDKVTVTDTKKIISKQSPPKKVASEVSDLLSDDAYNRTVYEDGTEGPIQSDTVIVTGPNVISSNKTHEEDVTSPSMEKKENNIKTDSFTSDANETADYQNVNPPHDKHSVSTITESNVKYTEKFTYSATTAEAAKGDENCTSPGDVIEEFTNASATDTNIAVKDAKKSYFISEKNKEKNPRDKSDNRTVKDETITKTESNVSIQDGTTIKPESSTTVKDETTTKSQTSTAFKDETTAKTESNTTVTDETTAKSDSSRAFKDETTVNTGSNTTVTDETTPKSESNITVKVETTDKMESNTTVKDETAAKTESLPSITDKMSVIKSTSTLPVQQSTITTPQPTMKAEPTTSVNISENVIDHKAEEDTLIALAASQQHADHSHASPGKSSAFLQPTESAAIFAGVFVGIALIGYIGLLVWRRVLEKRYGNREMLVNEDDFYDTNDLKNFEL